MTALYIITALFLIGVFGFGVAAIMEELGFFEYIKEKRKEKRKNAGKGNE